MTPAADPDKFPDVRPDRTRFWALRGLAWLFTLLGLGAVGFGLMHGGLAFYGTKNGAELERIVGAATWFGASVGIGMIMIMIGQAGRVLLAIEENTRLTAYNTRPRGRMPEPAFERRVPIPEKLKT